MYRSCNGAVSWSGCLSTPCQVVWLRSCDGATVLQRDNTLPSSRAVSHILKTAALQSSACARIKSKGPEALSHARTLVQTSFGSSIPSDRPSRHASNPCAQATKFRCLCPDSSTKATQSHLKFGRGQSSGHSQGSAYSLAIEAGPVDAAIVAAHKAVANLGV